jgi:hypothetical protein
MMPMMMVMVMVMMMMVVVVVVVAVEVAILRGLPTASVVRFSAGSLVAWRVTRRVHDDAAARTRRRRRATVRCSAGFSWA